MSSSPARSASGPFPVEIGLADGTVLRGLEHPADGPPLLFVHDVGNDLDAWGSLAAVVNSSGFRVIRLELRGHGLSDGEPDPSATLGDLRGALAEVTGAFGPVGLVMYGSAAAAAFVLDSDSGAPVQAVISPAPGSHDDRAPGDPPPGDAAPGDAAAAGEGRDSAVPAMRVLFTGAHDEPVHEHVRALHPKLRGQNMWISTGTALRGPTMLQEYPHLVEQLVTYMRRYLTGHHLAWIAEHAGHQQDSDE